MPVATSTRAARPASKTLDDTTRTSSAGPPRTSAVTAAQLAYTSYLRVVAMISVVLIHTAGLTFVNKDLRHTSAWRVAAVATFSTKWAVPVFVMVSGALLLRPPTDQSVSGFYRRRLSRIAIPLVVWHVVYITLTATMLTSAVPTRLIVAHFLRGESYTGLYFFWLILGLYLITPLLWPVVERFSGRALVTVGALLMATAALNQSALRVIGSLDQGRVSGGDTTLVTQFVPYIGFFVLGYALRDVIVRGTGRVLALAALTIALCLETTWQVTGPFVFGIEASERLNTVLPVSYQGWVLGAAAVAVFVLARSVVHPESRWAQPREARRARRAGELTLGVYAVHQLVLMALMRIPGHGWPSGAKTLPQLVLLCIATLLGATVLTIIIKKVPLLRRSV